MNLRLAAALLLATVLAPAAAAAATVPARLPALEGKDVTGAPQRLDRLLGPERTLLVVITDRKSSERMRAWFDAADSRAPASVERLSILTFRLPFYVSDAYARGKAREQVPREYWGRTLLDTRHQLRKQLGLSADREPWAFAVDRSGRILAAVHGDVDSAGAAKIWEALSAP